MQTINLAGTWSLRSADGRIETTIELPGDIYTALIASDHIPHPYEGRNELETQWVHKQDWILEREMELPEAEGSLTLFYAEVLDTIARVEINGHMIGESDNMFIPAAFPAGEALKAGTNRIRIFIDSAENKALERAAASSYPIPATPAPVSSPSRNFVRKAQCHGGWDWGPCIMTGGAYGELEIRSSDCLIEDLSYDLSRKGEVWTVRVHGTLHAGCSCRRSLRIAAAGALLEEEMELAPGGSCFERSLTVTSPELWWPSGEGEQRLYPLQISLGEWEKTLNVGFRTIEVVHEKDEKGTSMFFRVNGRDIFAKGANWIPTDALPSAQTGEKTRHLLESSVKAHMNMIRVWGGGQYETEYFYDLCDELGLLIWQDFMFSCSLYPSSREFLDSVDREVRVQIPRLKAHPCMALFCGNNEDLGALTWYEESRKNRDVYLVDYDRLNEGVIGRAVRELAPAHTWWPSSPSAGEGDYSDCWHDDSQGDMHYWSVWHEGKPFESYYDILPRFCSEFGFQSFPSLNAVKDYADEDQRNVTSPVMMHHQKNLRGNEIIISTLCRYFRFPSSFEDFIYLSQVQQAMAMKTAVEYWRANRPVCMGALYWQLNDNWPVASWSSIDSTGEWKLLHYEAARFFRPLHITGWKRDEKLCVRAVNDHAEARDVKAVINFRSFSGEILRREERELNLPSLSAVEIAVIDLPEPERRGLEFAELVLTDGKSRAVNAVFFDVPRMCELQEADICIDRESSPEGEVLILESSAPAFYIFLSAEKGVAFSDNGFHLMPGEKKRVVMTGCGPDSPLPGLRHLRQSY